MKFLNQISKPVKTSSPSSTLHLHLQIVPIQSFKTCDRDCSKNRISCTNGNFHFYHNHDPILPNPPSSKLNFFSQSLCSKPHLLKTHLNKKFGNMDEFFLDPAIKSTYLNSSTCNSFEPNPIDNNSIINIDNINNIFKQNVDKCSSPNSNASSFTKGMEWIPINSVWEASEEEALENVYIKSFLSPFWRILLLSDGSVTRHLHLLTGASITVDCFEMNPIGDSLLDLPADVEMIRGPRLQRQVFLRDKTGIPLVYAASWWVAEEVNGYLNEVQVPIWTNLSRNKIELYRNVRRLYIVHNECLETVFGVKGPFWARHYIFYHKGRPLTLIYEVFSPSLEKHSF